MKDSNTVKCRNKIFPKNITSILSPSRISLQASTPLAPKALSLRLTSISSNFFRLEQMIFRVLSASSSGRPAIMSLISAIVIPFKEFMYSEIFWAAPLSKLLLLKQICVGFSTEIAAINSCARKKN